jgi:hypothetical protein
MVRPEALTADETRALDGYHAEVRERLSALVRPEARDFLAERTRPLSEQT